MLEHLQLSVLLSGRNDPIWVCNVPNRVRVELSCSSGAVYLSKKSAEHILSKHNDIDTLEILLLPIAIDKGTFYREIDSDKFLSCVYREESGKIYFVSMKVVAKGHELWVSSMYRLTDRKLVKKLVKNQKL